MKEKLAHYITFLKPYKGILMFLFLLFFFHFSWKIAIDGDMEDDFMLFFGKDITPDWFHTACRWLTSAAAWLVHLFPNTQDLVEDDTLLYFPDGGIRISIIWGCTGIKQMFIFTGIMLFYRGPFLKKLWYIPMGCVILTIYNVIRVGVTVILTRGHAERFDSLHDGILRYIYYAIVFVLWLIWEEFIFNKTKISWKKILPVFKH
jgi:exosortase/archaeosortase family protein